MYYRCLMTNQVSLRYSPLGQLHVRFENVFAVAGYAAHRLSVQAQITGSWLDPEDPSNSLASVLLTGSVWTEQPGHRPLASLNPIVLTVRGFPTHETLSFTLTDDQVMELERARGENDLGLRLDLQATLLQPPAGIHPIAEEQGPLRIPRGDWTNLLDQLGTEVGITVRVPSPLTDPSIIARGGADEDLASLSQAAARLRAARAAMRDLDPEQCVANCRKVLENINLISPVPGLKSINAIPEKRTQAERWVAIYHSVRSMTHLAHHDNEDTPTVTWTRTDAEAILATTAGLLTHYISATSTGAAPN